MSVMTDHRFQLRMVSDTEWLIVDHRYAENDARHTVARVYQVGAVEVEVLWLRDLPLAVSYMTPDDVLADVRRFHTAPSRATSPITIPHLPPLAAA